MIEKEVISMFTEYFGDWDIFVLLICLVIATLIFVGAAMVAGKIVMDISQKLEEFDSNDEFFDEEV